MCEPDGGGGGLALETPAWDYRSALSNSLATLSLILKNNISNSRLRLKNRVAYKYMHTTMTPDHDIQPLEKNYNMFEIL